MGGELVGCGCCIGWLCLYASSFGLLSGEGFCVGSGGCDMLMVVGELVIVVVGCFSGVLWRCCVVGWGPRLFGCCGGRPVD